MATKSPETDQRIEQGGADRWAKRAVGTTLASTNPIDERLSVAMSTARRNPATGVSGPTGK